MSKFFYFFYFFINFHSDKRSYLNKYKEENNQLKIEFNERNKFINKLENLLKEKKFNFKSVNDFFRIFEETNYLNEDNKRLFINKTFY